VDHARKGDAEFFLVRDFLIRNTKTDCRAYDIKRGFLSSGRRKPLWLTFGKE
jgi:hypothetical protein